MNKIVQKMTKQIVSLCSQGLARLHIKYLHTSIIHVTKVRFIYSAANHICLLSGEVNHRQGRHTA